MGQASNRAKAARKARRRASQAERQVRQARTVINGLVQEASAEINQLKALLFALLAQAGGTLPVTKGTQEQVLDSFKRLSVTSSHPDGDETTLLVTLVEEPESEEPTDEHMAMRASRAGGMTITRVPEDSEIGTMTAQQGYEAAATINEGVN